MLNRKIFPGLILPALLCAMFLAFSSTLTSQISGSAAFRDVKKELMVAAAAHKVTIDTDRIMYEENGDMTIALAQIKGSEKYGDKEFKDGAAIQLLLFKSKVKKGMPDGSYLVKAQYEPGAASGKALFLDRSGRIVASRKLLIRTQEQFSALFPDVYPNPSPVAIPNITSHHTFCYLDSYGHEICKYYVDCGGWSPYHIIYYEI